MTPKRAMGVYTGSVRVFIAQKAQHIQKRGSHNEERLVGPERAEAERGGHCHDLPWCIEHAVFFCELWFLGTH